MKQGSVAQNHGQRKKVPWQIDLASNVPPGAGNEVIQVSTTLLAGAGEGGG